MVSARAARTGRWLLMVLLAGAVVGALVIAAGATGEGTAPTGGPEAGAPPADAIDQADLSAFAILRRAQTPYDQTQPPHAAVFSGASGANWSLARRPVSASGPGVWVIPGRGSLCLQVEAAAGDNGGAACTEDDQAAAGRLEVQTTSASEPGVELIAGLVPAGVTEVTIARAAGVGLQVAVHEGVYAAEVLGGVEGVSFETAAGQTTVAG